MSKLEPKESVSVITVVFNDAIGLKKTIKSVKEQSYQNIEFIIIDGNSTDNTVDVIRKNENFIDQWISEPDKGIYDAMNKGIDMASGEWLIFMNAGDWFNNSEAIRKIFDNLIKGTQLIYGNHEVIYDTYIKNKIAKPISEIWKGMVCSHQSLFVKAQLLKENKYNFNSYPIVADYHFIFNCWISNYKFQHVDITVACYQSGGISESKLIPTRWQTRKVVLSKINNLKTQLYFSKLILITYLTHFTRKILSPSSFEFLAKIKNTLSGNLK